MDYLSTTHSYRGSATTTVSSAGSINRIIPGLTYQSQEVTQKLADRVIEAIEEGLKITLLANAGDGEPTLHPEFINRMEIFGRMLKELDKRNLPKPETYVVTNGSTLVKNDIINAIADNGLGVNISFPTSIPDHYGNIMMMNPVVGEKILATVLKGIEKAMLMVAKSQLRHIKFHIAPPYRLNIRTDFPGTVDLLTRMAASAGLTEIELIMFSSVSNRTRKAKKDKPDSYNDLLRKYMGKKMNGVIVRMTRTHEKVYPRLRDILEVLKNFDFPCLVYGNPFITADGRSCCCNDQSLMSASTENLMENSLMQIMEKKAVHRPSHVCNKCNQAPHKTYFNLMYSVYSIISTIKMRSKGIKM